MATPGESPGVAFAITGDRVVMLKHNETRPAELAARQKRLRSAINMTETNPRVLVVEDESNVAEVVTRYLEREGFDADSVGDGKTALEMIQSEGADLVVLDIMLPGMDGLTVARKMREAGDRTPIIMLTARGQENDIVLGLGLGADDYMAKPFSPAELVARVHAVIRRSEGTMGSNAPSLSFGDLKIAARKREVTRSGEPVMLTQKEFDLLHFLASNPGTVFSREELLEKVWEYAVPGDTSTVTVHVRRLRAKVEADPEHPVHIKTVWGAGYRFDRE